MVSVDRKTIIVFSGDLDKAMAAFTIATGALAMGCQVTMFFTFWGLNILRKPEKVSVKKGFVERLLGFVMPRGPGRLGISKMNYGGLGARMMRKVMKDKNVQSLPELMETARSLGVDIIACTTSMDVMGITKEELIDGIGYAGVATYLAEADRSGLNLFIG